MTTRELLALPALLAVLAAATVLVLLEVLHVAGVRWRPGWLERAGVVAGVAAIALAIARFYVYT